MHTASSIFRKRLHTVLFGTGVIVNSIVPNSTLAQSSMGDDIPTYSTSVHDIDIHTRSMINVQSGSARVRADVINPPLSDGPANEFHLARLVFDVNAQHGWGPGRPWWRIDWPEAEFHFLNGLERYTVIDHANDSVHIQLNDDALFDYPWLFAQQAGRWHISDLDATTILIKAFRFLVDATSCTTTAMARLMCVCPTAHINGEV